MSTPKRRSSSPGLNGEIQSDVSESNEKFIRPILKSSDSFNHHPDMQKLVRKQSFVISPSQSSNHLNVDESKERGNDKARRRASIIKLSSPDNQSNVRFEDSHSSKHIRRMSLMSIPHESPKHDSESPSPNLNDTNKLKRSSSTESATSLPHPVSLDTLVKEHERKTSNVDIKSINSLEELMKNFNDGSVTKTKTKTNHERDSLKTKPINTIDANELIAPIIVAKKEPLGVLVDTEDHIIPDDVLHNAKFEALEHASTNLHAANSGVLKNMKILIIETSLFARQVIRRSIELSHDILVDAIVFEAQDLPQTIALFEDIKNNDFAKYKMEIFLFSPHC